MRRQAQVLTEAAVGTRILVIGYGNPSRGDDGAGQVLAERLEALRLPCVTVDADYQLSIEHAALAADHDVVVFADAAADLGDADDAFTFTPVSPKPGEVSFSHAVSPGQVLFLARACFGAAPRGFLLGLRAPRLEGFREGLSPGTALAVEEALTFLRGFIGRGDRAPESESGDA